MFYDVLIAFICGGIAGFGLHLSTHNKSMDFPKRTVTGWYLGFIADVFIGGVAAVLSVTFLVPEADTLRTIVGVSFLAGVCGESVILRRSLDNEKIRNKNLKGVDERLLRELDDEDND